jgi:hypothetical protein
MGTARERYHPATDRKPTWITTADIRKFLSQRFIKNIFSL